MPGRRISRQSLTHQTTDAVVDLIRDSHLREGDRLPSINDMAEQLGVSLTVAREAVAELAGQGLIIRKQGAGNVLALPGGSNIARIFSMRSVVKVLHPEHLQQFRFAVEVGAARLAAINAKSDDVAALGERLRELRVAASADQLNAADVAFHLCIAQISGNDLFEVSLEAINPLLRQLRDKTWAGWSSRGKALEDGVEQHSRIYEAIKNNDPIAAAQAMEDHLSQASESLAAVGETSARENQHIRA